MTIQTLDDYVAAVEAGEYPENPIVPEERSFTNENGSLRNLVYGAFGGATIIDSAPNSIRSNHYHKTDWHYLTVVEGLVLYYWRPAGSQMDPEMVTIRAGQTFFTPPMVEHAVRSLNNTRMISFSKLARRPSTHDADLVASPLIQVVEGKVVTVR